jgi:hypothetical protein
LEVDMQKRGFWVAASLAVGLLQAWDSGAFASGPVVLLLTIAGLTIPTAAIAMRSPDIVRIAGLAVGALLLVGARMVAPGPLNALHLALFPAALYILFLRGVLPDGQHQSA